MRLVILSSIFALALVLTGCAPKVVSLPQTTALVTIKTPTLTLQEPVFITRTPHQIRFDLALQPTATSTLIVLRNQICLEGYCLESSEFNQRYLDPCFEPETLWNALQGIPPPPSSCAQLEIRDQELLLTNKQQTIYLSIGALE